MTKALIDWAKVDALREEQRLLDEFWRLVGKDPKGAAEALERAIAASKAR